MGIKERKKRHKEDLRQMILDSALLLFRKYGYESTSIRKIAAEIEFSPTTIYLYYKDKSDIIFALHQEGFKLLSERFRSLAHVEHPFERLKAMGRNYLEFALEHPDFYELMFVMKEPMKFLQIHCADDRWQEGIATFNNLLITIGKCQEIGYFKDLEARAFSLVVWSTMHGLCTLTTHGHLDNVVRSHEMFEDGSKALEASFQCFLGLLETMK